MKKTLVTMACAALILSGTGCGTILGGKITDCQKTKPATGKRQIRPVALVVDLACGGVPTLVDFLDGAIYKPCNK